MTKGMTNVKQISDWIKGNAFSPLGQSSGESGSQKKFSSHRP